MAYKSGRLRQANIDWKGLRKARRIMKELPDGMNAEFIRAFDRSGPVVLNKARSETPVRTGALRSALSFKVYPRTLRMNVGLLTKGLNRKFFYGWILEVGRRAQQAKVHRGDRTFGRYIKATFEGASRSRVAGQRIVNATSSYDIRVSPISPAKYDIVGPRTRDFARLLMRGQLKQIYGRALRRIVAGGGDE